MSETILPVGPSRSDAADLSVLLGAPASPGRRVRTEQAGKVARDFESILLYRLLEEMKKTIPRSGLLDSGMTRQVEGTFWFYLAQEVAERGGIGLWKDLYRQIASPDGGAPTPSPPQPGPGGAP